MTRQAVLAQGVALSLAAGACAAQGAPPGQAIYAANCVPCHQTDGEGAPGIAPPLAGILAGRAKHEVGREFLAQILVSGMTGTLVSKGQRYVGSMPSFAGIPDADLAAVLNYVLAAFNGNAPPLAAADFTAARSRERTPAEVRKLRDRAMAAAGE